MTVLTCKRDRLVALLKEHAARTESMLVRELCWNAADRIAELEAEVAAYRSAETISIRLTPAGIEAASKLGECKGGAA